MATILTFLGISIASLLGFIGFDAKAAFDGDPNTHTLSEYLRRYGNKSRAHKFLLAFSIFEIALAPFYLLLHLVFGIF